MIDGALRAAWSYGTSNDPDNWNADNPAYGQCAVTALVIQDLLGGVLVAGWINGVRHYWNQLSDGTEVDFTREQFDSVRSIAAEDLPKDREDVLANEDTRRRYVLLRELVRDRMKEIE